MIKKHSLKYSIETKLKAEILSLKKTNLSLMTRIIDLKINNDELQGNYNTLQKQVDVLHQELEISKHHYAVIQRALFGKKSEKLKVNEELINDDGLVGDKISNDNDSASLKNKPSSTNEHPINIDQADKTKTNPNSNANDNNKKPGRKSLPENLPRQQIIYDLAESDKLCNCGCMLTKIGSDTSEQINFVPASLVIIEHIRYKYACKSCEDTVKRAEVPNKPIAKSNATSSLLAHVLVSKFVDHLPLYRQSQILLRFDNYIPRATLSNWVLACGTILTPLVALLKSDLVKLDYLCSDETPINVLNLEGQSYMWVHIGGVRENRAVVYDFQPSRSGEVALEFLNDFKGYHQCDAYSGYNDLHNRLGVICVGCWAHARRKFYEITKLVSVPGVADRILKVIGLLYDVEREADQKKLSPKQRRKLRLKKSVPILKQIKVLLDEYKELTPPKGMLGKAIAYSLNQWDSLNTYLLDGRIRIDNNDNEGVIRLIALGRRNWMFFKSENGAKAGANIYSIIQTAIANDIDVYSYLKYVFDNIKPAMTPEELRAFLPYKKNQANFITKAAA